VWPGVGAGGGNNDHEDDE